MGLLSFDFCLNIGCSSSFGATKEQMIRSGNVVVPGYGVVIVLRHNVGLALTGHKSMYAASELRDFV